MKRFAIVLILLLAFAGAADSAYVARSETAGTPLICNISNLSGCNVVAQSPYSRMFGIPIAEYGIVFYAIVFVLAALELVIFDKLLRRTLQWLAALGILASLYFTFLQVFVIGALCIYCLGSAVIALLVFACASTIEPLPVRRAAALPRAPRGDTPPPFTGPPHG